MNLWSTRIRLLCAADDETGDVEYSGDVYVEKNSIESGKEDINAVKFEFKGVMTKGTVA